MIKEFFKNDIRNFKGIDISHYENVNENDKAIVFIVHGLAEHSARYIKLGQRLRSKGIGSAAIDLPGHGNSSYGLEGLGIWPDDGYNFCIDAIHQSIRILSTEFEKPIILFGHSMGSFISLGYIEKYGNTIKACILSGTNDSQAPVLMTMGKTIAAVIAAIKGAEYKSSLLDTMSFGSYNSHFKPNRTKFDWISRDSSEVDKYIEDPYCGFIASTGLFKDLLNGLSIIYKKEKIAQIPDELPIYVFAGKKDPVGNFGKGPLSLVKRLKSGGKNNIKLRLYDETRHECLNELNSIEVMDNIIEFIEALEC